MELHDRIPSGDHKVGFIIEFDNAKYFREFFPPSSRKSDKNEKNKNKKNSSLGENRKAPLNHEKLKIKDISKGENLFEVPKDGGLDSLPIDREKSTLLIEGSKEVNLGTKDNPRIIQFAASLTIEEKPKFTTLFSERQANFACSYVDIPGLDPEMVLHHLPLLPNAKKVKQKLIKMHPQIALLVKVELKKLLDVRFIHPIDYARWISNLFLVTKLTSSIKIYTSFRDLNKACPKDDFSLPNIDIIVDLMVGYEMLSLMDRFLGYNYIIIATEDQHKTTFTCTWGTFCCNLMTFGLRNSGATYKT